jgi:hypothetical protein
MSPTSPEHGLTFGAKFSVFKKGQKTLFFLEQPANKQPDDNELVKLCGKAKDKIKI